MSADRVALAAEERADAPRPERVRCPGCGYEDCPRPDLECGGYHRLDGATLTDEERALGQEHSPHHWFREDDVETILAAREKALREEIGERIEALPDVDGLWGLVSRAHAARIARGGTR